MNQKYTTTAQIVLWGAVVTITTMLADPATRVQIEQVLPREWMTVLTVVAAFLGLLMHRIGVMHNPDGGPVAAPYAEETGTTITRSRADRHSNLLCATTEMCEAAGLILGRDYLPGDPIDAGAAGIKHTARIISDPIAAAIRILESHDRVRDMPGCPLEWWRILYARGAGRRINEMSLREKLSAVKEAYIALGGSDYRARLAREIAAIRERSA